jgi:L-alanine-DL-glutamate epimerase-like enolase superfamily enzyme
MSLEVTDVTAIPVEAGVKSREDPDGLAPYVNNHGRVESIQRILVRVDTDSTTGWGEMLVAMRSPRATKAVIEDVLAPELVGRSVGDVQSFVESFYFPYVKVDPFVGAVEMAMWDALGKHLGASVSQLLGGAITDSVEVAYCLGILDPEESREHVQRAVDGGFSTLKTKASADWRRDVRRLEAMADEADGALEFRVDPNQGWRFEDAVRAATALEEAGIYLQYLEQPVRIDTFGTYEQLRSRIRQPLAVNEDTYFRRNLHHLLKFDAVDVAVLDLIPAGGILRAKELAALASNAGISVSHHNGFDLGVKQAAVLHTAATTPAINLPPDSVYYAWERDVLGERLALDDGRMPVPEGPGLGVEVDEAAVEDLRTD